MKKHHAEMFKNLTVSYDLNDRILICDSINLFIRCFAANPIISESGYHVGGQLGFLKAMASYIRMFNPTRCILVFDGVGGSSYRRKIYPDYKANRKNKNRLNRTEKFNSIEEESESMKMQLGRLLEYMDHLPVTCIAMDDIEADDTIAYLVKQYYEEKAKHITIVSTDRDFLQLVNESVTVYSPTKKIIYTPEILQTEYQMHHENILLYRSLSGDTSDNIPGVKGVGKKTLLKISDMDKPKSFSEFKSEMESLAESGSYKVVSEIVNNWEIVERNYKLMQLEMAIIPTQTKLKIQDIADRKIPTLNKHKLRHFAIEDQIIQNISNGNIEDWVNTSFSRLNACAIQNG